MQMRQSFFAFSALLLTSLFCSFVVLQEEVGKAGYYADSLHGRKTASGEKYDKNDFTCAHKTLPFGTRVRVTRLDNKKSVVVRVNDRGPFVEGYVTDISRAAAEEIDLIKIGVTKVKLEVLESSASGRVAAESDGNTQSVLTRNSQKPITASTNGSNATGNEAQKLPSELYSIEMKPARKEGFGVQVSTMYNAENVLSTINKLEVLWPSQVLVNVERDEAFKKSTYRVIIGPFPNSKAAAVQQKLAAKKGYKGCFVVDLGAN